MKFSEIPSIFWSDLTNQPFNKCISCECDLLKRGTQYLIEKALQSTEKEGIVSTIFEYAICFDCVELLRSQLSASSLSNIDQFYEKRVNMAKRRKNLWSKVETTEKEWMKECIVNNRPHKPGEEFQIYGQCDGDRLFYYDMPFMISGEALDEMIELISTETMDELDNFKDSLISGPPEFKELLESGGPRVFI